MTGILLVPCKSTAAYEALPNKNGRHLNLNLNKIKNLMISMGYEEICDARVMIIMKKKIEITLYPSGKLIIKTESKSDAEIVMNEIYNKILNQ